MLHLSGAKCGEETSPTPQTDWSLAHGFKTAFGLKSYGNFDSTIRFHESSGLNFTGDPPRISALQTRQLLCQMSVPFYLNNTYFPA